MLGHRLPQRGVHRVVVDHQHFEIRVVQPGERIEGLAHHVRRLVADRQVDADLGQHAPAAAGAISGWRRCTRPNTVSASSKLSAISRNRSSAWPAASEPQTSSAKWREVLAGHRQQHQREDGAEALRQAGHQQLAGQADVRAAGQQQPGHQCGAERGEAGPDGPVGRFRDRAAHRPFGLAVEVDHAPVAGGAALEAGLPGLVERFHDEVVQPALLRDVEEVAHEHAPG